MTQSLVERIGVAPHREKVIEDCCGLVDAQVKAKSGFSGIAIKGVYATVKTFKRGFVPSVVNAMLDEWLGKLQPYHDKWAGADGGFAQFLIARSDDVAEDLLLVTDARAKKSEHGTVKNSTRRTARRPRRTWSRPCPSWRA
ncbi:MAG: hypothetical protein IPL61_06650 [Myxococcales bacterium]|nr:hypothetical protein [Myxococcales bacterium]